MPRALDSFRVFLKSSQALRSDREFSFLLGMRTWHIVRFFFCLHFWIKVLQSEQILLRDIKAWRTNDIRFGKEKKAEFLLIGKLLRHQSKDSNERNINDFPAKQKPSKLSEKVESATISQKKSEMKNSSLFSKKALLWMRHAPVQAE